MRRFFLNTIIARYTTTSYSINGAAARKVWRASDQYIELNNRVRCHDYEPVSYAPSGDPGSYALSGDPAFAVEGDLSTPKILYQELLSITLLPIWLPRFPRHHSEVLALSLSSAPVGSVISTADVWQRCQRSNHFHRVNQSDNGKMPATSSDDVSDSS